MAQGDSPENPLPVDTTKTEPKVKATTFTAAGLVTLGLALCQLLTDNANLIAGLPDWLEPILLGIATGGAVYGAGYTAKHQYRAAVARRAR